MKHSFSLEGYVYRLRPVKRSDARFIIEARLEDAERNRFIHAVSSDTAAQEAWIDAYFAREGDFYFVVENRLTGQPEGLIGFYDVSDENGASSGSVIKAEWGRWVIRKGSLAAAESVYLLYRIAFEQAGVQELYCRTITANTAVVSFHTSIGEKTRMVHPKLFELNGVLYDAVEQYSGREHFYQEIAPLLEKQSAAICRRSFARAVGGFAFHHIGVAARSIQKELPHYTLMGYEKAGAAFEDPLQGIRGLFLEAKDQPRLELLENLEGSRTLDKQLEHCQKLYHTAYYVGDIEKAVSIFTRNRARIISPLKPSVYFGKRICFLVLPNMGMIELLEK